MNRRLAGALIAVIVLLGALALIFVLRRDDGGPADATPEQLDVTELEEAEPGELTLYFPDQRGTLSPEQRPLPLAGSAEERARALLEALLAGPTEVGLVPPLPEGTSLGPTHLAPNGVLYVDLLSADHPRPPAQGSLQELLLIYSLVDTVLLNTPEIDSVVLLWNGRQPEAFAGHVDTSLPLRADRDLIARRR